MSGKHGGESSGGGLEIELRQVVQHVEDMGAQLDDVIGRKLGCPRTLVVVAAHCVHRGERPQRIQNGAGSDVSAMNDRVASAQLLEGLRPDEPMRVRNHADDVLQRHR